MEMRGSSKTECSNVQFGPQMVNFWCRGSDICQSVSLSFPSLLLINSQLHSSKIKIQ